MPDLSTKEKALALTKPYIDLQKAREKQKEAEQKKAAAKPANALKVSQK